MAPADLRELALAVRNQPGVDVVVLGGESRPAASASSPPCARRRGVEAAALIRDAAKAVGGGGGGKGDVATAGGKDPAGIDEALRIAAEAAAAAPRLT